MLENSSILIGRYHILPFEVGRGADFNFIARVYPSLYRALAEADL